MVTETLQYIGAIQDEYVMPSIVTACANNDRNTPFGPSHNPRRVRYLTRNDTCGLPSLSRLLAIDSTV